MVLRSGVGVTLLNILDISALIPLGLSGGGLAVRKGMDFYGAMVLAVVTALGGGIAADLMLGRVPRVILEDWLLLLAAGSGLAAFLLGERLLRWHKIIAVLDALGLGLYAIAGAQRGISAGASLTGIVFLGVLTGSGGGMLRDVLAGEIPFVLRKEIYALAAAGGALTYGLLVPRLGATPALGLAIAACVTVVRLLAIYFGLNTASARRDPPLKTDGL